MKLRKIKKEINRFYKHWKILKEVDAQIQLVYPKKIFDYIGFFYVDENFKLKILLNAHYFLVNDKNFLLYTLKHEFAHLLQYVINGGFKLNENGEVIEHDEEFQILCKKIGIKFFETCDFKVNRNFKHKPVKGIKLGPNVIL
jgi:predicted SprT family Zn-dependent metalloprotease